MRVRNNKVTTLAILVLLFLNIPFALTAETKKQDNLPMMGWSSWNTFRINIDEALIKSVADSMVSKGFRDAGYRFVNIDDGFFGGRRDDGSLFCNSKFPQGMAPLVFHIHSLGMKAGIYSDAGPNTCGSIYDNDKLGIGVGLWNHEDSDCKLFFDDWKFDFIKVDFCGGSMTGKSDEERYRNISHHIKNRKRKDIRLNICRWQFPGTWAISFADSWRIDTDISPNFNKVDEIIIRNLYLGAYSSLGHYNDMDMLEMGRGLSNDEEKTHFGIWCIMASPLLIGCDIRSISEQTTDILLNKEVIALNQDPLGLQAKVVSYNDSLIVLAKDIKKLYSKTRALAIYNRSSKSMKVDLSFKDLLLEGSVLVRDLWKHTQYKTDSGSLSVEVPAHGCALYTLLGDCRIDQSVYEFEDSYLNAYSPELSNATVKKNNKASNSHLVTNLGGDAANWCKLPNIHISKAGQYKICVHGFNKEAAAIKLDLNGRSINTEIAGQSEYSPFVNEQIVKLKKGNNELVIFSNGVKSPDFDKLEIIPMR